ncbi:multicopper oxidase [Chlorella sorokiniana]|uniref:Multicopper oxidase n=1 Tax=Chlorella sorokiniana TaxID=3076 RepID=A0A2P6TGI3_CHLSO|nr:multicopper oxidase [Chlorella sorokiniana]|eukprot:PRW33210.1 multicopper oxidase [Chlorella sorokiniana]
MRSAMLLAALVLALDAGPAAAWWTPPRTSCGSALGSATGLPVAAEGGFCGAGLARCRPHQCCSQEGVCQTAACPSTCQCEFSGRRSQCPGSMLLTNVPTPVAPPAGPCGDGVATCPGAQCCSVLGFCTNQCAQWPVDPKHSGPKSKCWTPKTTTRHYRLELKWSVGAPDGFQRALITVNGQMPGPTLRANVGDRLIITVVNKLPANTTIHWHGILQRGTNIMDGVPGVTQVALKPFATQIYDFVASMPGAYWYHSHFKGQYIDGLRGAMVIRDPRRPRFPAEADMQLTDWYHTPAAKLMKEYLTPASQGNEPVPITALMNGIGQGSCTSNCGRYAVLPAAPGNCSLPGTRIRIYNQAAFAWFTVRIDGHRMMVMALDGLPVNVSQPLRAIRINAGQRVTVAVCPDASHPAGKPAWIRAEMEQFVFATDAQYPLVLGVLQYGELTAQPRQLPTTKPDAVVPSQLLASGVAGAVSEYSLKPVSWESPPAATERLLLNLSMYNDPDTNWAHFSPGGNISMSIPPKNGGRAVPSIVQALLGRTPLPPNSNFGYNTYFLKPGAVVDIIINNFDTGEHPLHLHGHWFWVMAQGLPNAGTWNPSIPLNPTPILRDTATVNEGSYMVLRFVASNRGVWIFHCHIDWHLGAGLALVFAYV